MARYGDALTAARRIAGKIPEFIGDADSLDKSSSTGQKADAWQLFEVFLSQPIFTMVRFGDWQAVLEEPRPPQAAQFMTRIWHYARGLAEAHNGSKRKASQELRQLNKLIESDELAEYRASLNGARTLLTIAANVPEDEIEAADGDYDEAIAAISTAVRLQDSLLYMQAPD